MRRALSLLLAAVCLAAFCPGYSQAVGIEIPYTNTDIHRYLLEIDTRNQIATVYARDANNEYTKVVRQMLCTTGDSENPTPRGTFTMGTMRERFGYFANFNVYAQYWTQIVRGIYIHSVLYSKRNENSMQQSTYRNLGRAVSHGCIRMLVEDARFIYYNLPPGSKCVITSSKAKNSALAKSLRSTIPASQYRPSPDPNPEPSPLPAVVITKTAPLMTGYSSKDRRLGTLKQGQLLDVIQYGQSWHKVRLPNKREGYLLTKYLSFDVNAPLPVYEKRSAVKVTTALLYPAPDTDETPTLRLSKNTQVIILDKSVRNWLKVSVDNIQGWVLSKQIGTIEVQVTPAPTRTAAPAPTPVPTPAPVPGKTLETIGASSY